VEFKTEEANKILAALGLEGVDLPPRLYNEICGNVLRMDVFHTRAEQYFHRRFAAEIILSMPEAEREQLAKRAGGATYYKAKKLPSQWEVIILGVEFKPAMRVICPACNQSDGFVPMADKGLINKTFPTIEEQMVYARMWIFKHCGKEERVPANVLAEYERRIKPFCHGYQATAADYEAERNQRATAALSNRQFISIPSENVPGRTGDGWDS
jgi:hypothetical protein